MTRWQSAPLRGGLGSHAERWDALNQRIGGNHPLLDSRFVDALLQHFGRGDEHLFWLEQHGQLQGMCILRPHSRMRWASFLPPQLQLGPTLVAERAQLEGLCRSLPAGAVQLDLLCNDPLVGGVNAVTRPLQLHSNHALTMQVTLQGSFEDYWSARSRSLQSNMRRYQKRAVTDGLAPRYTEVSDPAEVGEAVARYAALEGASWKGREGTAISHGGQLPFYQNVLVEAAQQGHGRVYELWFGERLVASRLVLARGSMLVMMKTAYDAEFARYAPGRLLLHDLLRRAFSQFAGQVIEFYTDADQNLLEWGTAQRWIQHDTLYRYSAVEALAKLRQVLGGQQRQRQALANGRYTVDAIGSVEALPDDARACIEQAGQGSSDAGCDWYRNLIETVMDCDDVVRFYVLRRDGLVQAVLPLHAVQHSGGWQLHALSNFYTSLYQPAFNPCLKAADLLVLLAAVQRDFPGASHLTMKPMDPSSHAYQVLLDALRKLGWLPFEYFSFGNWFLTTDSNWPAYLAARPGAVRSTLKRMGRKFSQAGGTLEIVTGGARLPEAIAAYEAVYAHSWKVPEPYPAFLPGLMRLCAAQGSLRLGLAWLDGKAVAAQFWIVRNGKAMIYKLAYDESAKPYAPGTLLSAHLMQHVMEVEQVQEVDYLQGDDPYKQLWMSERRERWGIVAYQPRTLAGLAGALHETIGRATRRLRQRERAHPPRHTGWRRALPEQ
ncbi:GNAT family N-acetyltransferase [Duganella sp. Root1480D1]|uniref:GNAT family N-acetyltransferase n=1 Tax=Duganella sp. Root1480D1 TaxID=1736471 RepID=UPI00070DABA7|nr:GNAT family N-acetyltransferase [Duganella sp. Root1480D1]KQZ26004.1 hypothetical protein ASD58_18110 [Duganella sp. Root1480D1]